MFGHLRVSKRQVFGHLRACSKDRCLATYVCVQKTGVWPLTYVAKRQVFSHLRVFKRQVFGHLRVLKRVQYTAHARMVPEALLCFPPGIDLRLRASSCGWCMIFVQTAHVLISACADKCLFMEFNKKCDAVNIIQLHDNIFCCQKNEAELKTDLKFQ